MTCFAEAPIPTDAPRLQSPSIDSHHYSEEDIDTLLVLQHLFHPETLVRRFSELSEMSFPRKIVDNFLPLLRLLESLTVVTSRPRPRPPLNVSTCAFWRRLYFPSAADF